MAEETDGGESPEGFATRLPLTGQERVGEGHDPGRRPCGVCRSGAHRNHLAAGAAPLVEPDQRGVFKRAVRDRVIAYNPCAGTELPKVITKKPRIPAPAEFDRLLAYIPTRFLPLVLTEIETGLRWGELIALRPRHIDFLRRTLTVEETIVEVSKKNSPTGQRMIVKPYPKEDEPRVLTVSQELLDVLAARVQALGLGRDDLLFPSKEIHGGNPLSRNTFRTRVWFPALEKSELGFNVRMHDLRHANASWLLAGGADLKAVLDRLGHSQIQTTQRYLHSLPGADQKALAAFKRLVAKDQVKTAEP